MEYWDSNDIPLSNEQIKFNKIVIDKMNDILKDKTKLCNKHELRGNNCSEESREWIRKRTRIDLHTKEYKLARQEDVSQSL